MNKKCWCCSWKHHKTHHWVQLSFFSDGLLLRIVPVKVQCSCFLCLHYINHDDDDTKELSDCNKEMVAADLHSIFLIEAIKYFGWWWWVTGVHHNINTVIRWLRVQQRISRIGSAIIWEVTKITKLSKESDLDQSIFDDEMKWMIVKYRSLITNLAVPHIIHHWLSPWYSWSETLVVLSQDWWSILNKSGQSRVCISGSFKSSSDNCHQHKLELK